MNILLYTPAFLPHIGGLEVGQASLADAFVRHGHEVVVVTKVPSPVADDQSFKVLRRPGVVALLRAIRASDIYVQANVSLRGLWPMLLIPRPWVVSHHSWYCRTDGHIAWPDRLKRYVLRYAESSISVSHAMAEDLDTRSIVIPNAYRDTEFRRLPDAQRTRDLVFLGRLVSDKGVDILIGALSRLRRSGLKPSLTIIGEGPDRTPLEAQVAREGLVSQVHFEGARLGRDLVRLLNQHRILVVPSRYNEPFGIVALEGIACGCRVIGSSGGGLPEAIGPGGLTFPNGSEERLAALLAEVLPLPPLADPPSAEIQQHLDDHRSDRIAKLYLDAFEQAVEDFGRRRPRA